MKKIKFEDLKWGQYFKYYRKLYIKDDNWCSGINLETGQARYFKYNANVIPVKVEIKIKEK